MTPSVRCVLLCLAGAAGLRVAVSPELTKRRVFVRNIPYAADAIAVRAAIAPVGSVETEDIWLPEGEDGGACRGFGTVTFGSEDAAHRCLHARCSLLGRTLLFEPCDADDLRRQMLRQLQRSASLVEVETCLSESRPLRDAKEYTMAIGALGRVGAWQRALDELDAMGECDVAADAFVFAAVIKACELCGQVACSRRSVPSRA